MILAASRFRVANGMEDAVREAFLDRPGHVDHAPGFLGMEVFADVKDPCTFHLLTRWTDSGSFHAWHRSDAHKLSHSGIPKGLKLDRAFTKVVELERLQRSSTSPDVQVVADHAPLIARFLAGSQSLHMLVIALDGTIESCSQAIEAQLGLAKADLVGRSLWTLLANADAESLRARVAGGERNMDDRFLVNFSNETGLPYTLRCRLDVQPDAFVLIGEPAEVPATYTETMLQLNNELAILNRENARKGRALAKALADLEQAQASLAREHAALHDAYAQLDGSFWHLQKLQEFLPICMQCGNVKGAESAWEPVVDYLKKNSLFLSHGFCPTCAEAAMREMDTAK